MKSDKARAITHVSGRPLPLVGNEIDTDQIIPARFMTAVTFDGLGEYAFQDLRYDQQGKELDHPMNDPRFQAKGPRVAVVQKNFGCGSSREHAPQSLWRWGIHALVGESFADIFFNNCVSMGIPCVMANEQDIRKLLGAIDEDPAHDLLVDVDAMKVTYRGVEFATTTQQGARNRLLSGAWDATGQLVGALDAVRETASKLPYVRSFRS